MLRERGIFERVALRWAEVQPANSQKFKYLGDVIEVSKTDRRITGVRRGRKRVPICKGGVEVEGVGVAILLTKREHGIFPSF